MMAKNIQMNRKKVRGAVAVEMAFLMIPLIVMAFGVAEFGRAIYEYNTLTKSVRDAVRHVSQSEVTDSKKAEAVKLAVYGTITDAAPTPLLPNLSESNVGITSATDATGINMVTVTITGYTFDFAFNPLVFFGNTTTSLTFGDIHATMRQL
jgi:Flp pilus assembly protein TadG